MIYPKNWHEYRLEDIGEIIGGGTPSTKIDSYYNGKIAWITPRDLSNHNEVYISKGERSISEKGLKNSSARLMPQETVLFTSRAPIGYIAIAKNEVSTNQGFKSIICNKNANNKFIYYWLKHNKDMIESLASGSTFKEISGGVLKLIKIILPSVEEQIKISNILYKLDSKIELLQKQNDTLEKIGQTIFKQWFVDFEFPNEEGKPYKSSGGEMIESELGEIPKGWSINNYGNLLEFERGIEPGSRNYLDKPEEDTVLFYRVGDLLSEESRVYVKKNIIKNKISNLQNVLVSFDGTVGRVKIGINGSYSTGIRKVYSSDGSFSNGYIFFLMNSKFIQDKIVEFAKGTTILHAGEAVKNFITAIPSEQTRSNFNVFSDKIYLKLLNNLNAIKSLQKTRDLLLPKLMSGQIRVPLEVQE
ncbi:MAG: restriction endonuclease subunit S [Nanoarchaeota archaeon]|nr:restriction endonuclease subunit S [Nanoarchaeota archaeon]